MMIDSRKNIVPPGSVLIWFFGLLLGLQAVTSRAASAQINFQIVLNKSLITESIFAGCDGNSVPVANLSVYPDSGFFIPNGLAEGQANVPTIDTLLFRVLGGFFGGFAIAVYGACVYDQRRLWGASLIVLGGLMAAASIVYLLIGLNCSECYPIAAEADGVSLNQWATFCPGRSRRQEEGWIDGR